MGNWISRLVEKIRGVREVRLLMLGLDNAGKTTILYKLKFNQTVTTIPTAGFNVECLMHKNDVGGQDKIRPLWRHYHTGTKALIFVVDSQDRDRIHEARLELHRILTARELQEAILLVFANKQDLTNSMGVDEVRERLQLDKFPHRTCTVRPSCATTGEGLVEGLSWLADCIKNPPSSSSTGAKRVSASSSGHRSMGSEVGRSPSPDGHQSSNCNLGKSPTKSSISQKPPISLVVMDDSRSSIKQHNQEPSRSSPTPTNNTAPSSESKETKEPTLILTLDGTK